MLGWLGYCDSVPRITDYELFSLIATGRTLSTHKNLFFSSIITKQDAKEIVKTMTSRMDEVIKILRILPPSMLLVFRWANAHGHINGATQQWLLSDCFSFLVLWLASLRARISVLIFVSISSCFVWPFQFFVPCHPVSSETWIWSGMSTESWVHPSIDSASWQKCKIHLMSLNCLYFFVLIHCVYRAIQGYHSSSNPEYSTVSGRVRAWMEIKIFDLRIW